MVRLSENLDALTRMEGLIKITEKLRQDAGLQAEI